MQPSVIEVKHLYKAYRTAAGDFPVLKDVNLQVLPGDYVAIMGPSGSGKSTFMNILGCLDMPTAGSYVLDGYAVASMAADQVAKVRNQTIGFVFQGFNLLARASLLDNVALPLVYAGVSKEARHARARLLLEKVGLSKHLDSHPNQISGGQQQRVAIARALVNQPRLILADEPTGNLDRLRPWFSCLLADSLIMFDKLHPIFDITHRIDRFVLVEDIEEGELEQMGQG